MPAGSVMSVITTDMACHQPLHPFVELIRLLGLDEQMKMVRHEAPCMNLYCIFFSCMEQQFNKGTIVTVLVKDLLPAVTTID